MKRSIYIVTSVLASLASVAQTNSFPASGNAAIGTTPGTAALTIERYNNDASFPAMISVRNTNPIEPTGATHNLAGTNYYAGNGEILGQIVANYGTGLAVPWNIGTGLYLTTRTNHPIVFVTGVNGSERMRISPNGNVSIGTSNAQGYAFAVNGNSIFTRVKVKQVGLWPDYVFSDTYPLMSLNNLDSFISLKKHLPDVPAAAEVSKDGLDVGEFQALLLKKIEELTVYLIAQHKTVEALRLTLQTQDDTLRSQAELINQLQIRENARQRKN